MRLRDTKPGAWLTLIRVQSTPLTVLSLLVGYGIAAESVVTVDAAKLIVVGSLAHWGGFALNDVADYVHDKQAGRCEKPLVRGDIHFDVAEVVSMVLILLSVGTSAILLNRRAAIIFIISALIGVLYNYKSKIMPFREFVLGVWAMSLAFSGAAQSGAPTRESLIFGISLMMLISWLSAVEGLKEYDNETVTIPHFVDHVNTGRMKYVAVAMAGVVVGGSQLTCITRGNSVCLLFCTTAGAIFLFVAYVSGGGGSITIGDRKAVIANAIAGVSLLLITTIPAIGPGYAALMLIITVVWGLGWQKILFGETLYFP